MEILIYGLLFAVLLVGFVGGTAYLVVRSVIDLKAKARQSQWAMLSTTDHLGNKPTPFHLDSGFVADVAPGNAPPANVPTTLTYAPHTIIKNEGRAATDQLPAPVLVVEDPAQREQTITATDAIALLERNTFSWCIGVDATGKPIILPIREAVHVLNVAGSGQGKTSLTANLILQLIVMNDASLYWLWISDLKGTITRPFASFAKMLETSIDGYLKIMGRARAEVQRRADAYEFDEPIVLVVVEEMFAAKSLMTKEQRAQFFQDLKYVGSVGREYGVFLLSCMQVAYSDPDFKEARPLYMTRLAGAIPPQAAQGLGFEDYDLIKKLWKDKRPGQFLLEDADGSRIIQTPRLDLKKGELITMLKRFFPGGDYQGQSDRKRKPTAPPVSQQEQSGGNYTAPSAEPVEPIAPFTPPPATGPHPADQPKVNIPNSDNVVDGWFRTLGIGEPEPDDNQLPAPSEVTRALTAWRMGANSVAKLEKALKISHRQAYKLVQKLKDDGLITE